MKYRIFIKGVKAFLDNEIDEVECPFAYAEEMLNKDERYFDTHDICVKNCGMIFKELVCKNGTDVKGCPCVALPKNKRKNIRKMARVYLNTTTKEYKMLYR